MKWGDTLCGVEVTPESWNDGGVAESAGGDWYAFPRCGAGAPYFTVDRVLASAPIFPPASFAGKTDAELWAAVFGTASYLPIMGDRAQVVFTADGQHRVDFLTGTDEFGNPRDCVVTFALVEVPALTLALQNAQVLAQRLRTTTEQQ